MLRNLSISDADLSMPRLPPRVNDMAIRLMLSGCTNRPFYHIVAMSRKKARDAKATEQLGSYDPMPNADNEKLVSLNFERLRYWLACGANATKPVQQLLGRLSWRNFVHIRLPVLKSEQPQSKLISKTC